MNFRIFILIFIFSISCDSPKSNYTPKSSGNINTLTVVMENSIWESSVGDVVRESFASEFLGLPQQEPIFSLKQMPFEAFSGFTRESRNILLAPAKGAYTCIGAGSEALAATIVV